MSINLDETDPVKRDRYEKINKCVVTGSLIIAAGIGLGTLFASIVSGPTFVYLGTSVSYVIAADLCYTFLRREAKVEEKVAGSCDTIYDSTDKSVTEGCKYFPAVTEKGKACIQSKKDEELEKRKNEPPVCRGRAMDDNRFRWPSPSCNKRPCLKYDSDNERQTDKKSSSRKRNNDDVGDGDGGLKPVDKMIPLKRFKNPLRTSDLITSSEAFKETFRTFPLKRFTNPKIIIGENFCYNHKHDNK